MPDPEIVSDPSDRAPEPVPVGKARAKGKPRHAPTPPGLGVTYATPEDFAAAMQAAYAAGVITPFPVPPVPVPGDWFRKAVVIWLRSITPLGPITIAR
jgi:hypothetical protein